jgi:hypothetical protein
MSIVASVDVRKFKDVVFAPTDVQKLKNVGIVLVDILNRFNKPRPQLLLYSFMSYVPFP